MSTLLPRPRRARASLAAVTALLLSLPVAAGTQVPDQQAPPGILVTQHPTFQTVRAGERAGFVVSVTNTGGSTLLDVAVTSEAVPACARDASSLGTLAAMAPGARVTYECTDVPRFADYTNRVVAGGSDDSGRNAADWADSVVEVLNPDISIYKDTRGGIISAGDTATFVLTVRNEGDMELIGVDVTDPLVPDCNRNFSHLGVGAEQTWTCSLSGVTAGLTNVVEVSAQPAIRKEPVGDRIGDRDTADIRVPGISIDKSTLTPIVRVGSASDFEITVENTGSIALVGATVTDPAVPACDRSLGTIGTGDSVSYRCTLEATPQSFTNVATVDAAAAEGGPAVSDSDGSDVEVIDPSIHVIKTVDRNLIRDSGPAVFTITVTNNGDSPLRDVVVGDEASPACERLVGDLPPAGSVTYSCSVELTESLLNTAIALGVPLAGDRVVATDDAAVEVIHPSVEILKTVDDATVEPGGTATFTLAVTNSGDTELNDVEVTDPATPTCDRSVGSLAAGETVTHRCESVPVEADFTNVAEVVGTPRLGADVVDSDSVAVDRVDPALAVAKTAGATAIPNGADATFALTVTNPGDTDLFDVRIVDSAVPDCDRTFPLLAAGGSQTWTCVARALTADLLNVVTADATTPDGHSVSATDQDTVTVAAAAVAGTQQTPTTSGTPLAVTGNDPQLVLMTSVALMGVGALLWGRSRRRRRR